MKANNKITINFDLDGCLVGLYDVPNWLDMLTAEDTTPLRRCPAPASPVGSGPQTEQPSAPRLSYRYYLVAVQDWLCRV